MKERITHNVVDVFNRIQKYETPGTTSSIHLKVLVDDELKSSRGPHIVSMKEIYKSLMT